MWNTVRATWMWHRVRNVYWDQCEISVLIEDQWHVRQCALTGSGLLLMVIDGERNTDPGRVALVPCASVSFSVNGEHNGTHLGGLLWRWNELIRVRCLEKHLCVKYFLNISPDGVMASVVVCTRLSLDSISVSSCVLIHVVVLLQTHEVWKLKSLKIRIC